MDVLTLKGRGVELVLFVPREDSGWLEAGAFMVLASPSRPRTVQYENKKYRLPVLPERGFYLMPLCIPGAPGGR